MSRRTESPQKPRSRRRAKLPTGRTSASQGAPSLARERRLRALDAAVKREIAGNPALAARLGKHLAGELPAMKQDRTLTIRLPGALLERAEALIPALTADPSVTAARGGSAVGLSAVVRMALLEGLAVLESRHGR